ncbi:MAG: hypothetical protein RLZZ299_646 [Pseudomonadota bacterium]|jgi:hypothetical protein
MRRLPTFLLSLASLTLSSSAALAGDEAAATGKVVKNTSFNVTLTMADGTTRAGHVQGVERAVDVYADQGFTEDARKLTLDVELPGAKGKMTERAVPWTDVKSLTIAPVLVPSKNPKLGKLPDISCTFDSGVEPWMYECSMATVSSITLKDGTKGNVITRHPWRFTFDDGSTVTFTAAKHTVRAPEDREIEPGRDEEAKPNEAIYAKLQQQIRDDAKTRLVKTVVVTP